MKLANKSALAFGKPSKQKSLVKYADELFVGKDDEYYTPKNFEDRPLDDGAFGDLVHLDRPARGAQVGNLRFFTSLKSCFVIRDFMPWLDSKFRDARDGNKKIAKVAAMGADGSLVDAPVHRLGIVFDSIRWVLTRVNFGAVAQSGPVSSLRTSDGFQGGQCTGGLFAYYAILRIWFPNCFSCCLSHLATLLVKRQCASDNGSQKISQISLR